ncbi:MAG: thiamine pyrophosphate-dependent enzyme [Myxococcota bacterium]
MEPTPWDPEGVTVVLDHDGQLVGGAQPSGLDTKQFYKMLVAARCLDLRLARSGLPMWASAAGEEAALVSTALVSRERDWIYAGFRDVAVALARGLELDAVVAGLFSGEAASPGRIASATHRIAPPTDALGMHLALASGRAHAQKLRGDGDVTFALFGEGLTTTGAFHESSMLAVSNALPMVMVCRSQLWPNGAPAEAGAVGDSVSDRAKAAGFFVRRVDGADALGTHAAITAAADRARQGRGPGFVEVVVTQMHRDPPAHRDPVERLRRHLDKTGAWTQTLQDVIEAEVRGGLDRALEAVQSNETAEA